MDSHMVEGSMGANIGFAQDDGVRDFDIVIDDGIWADEGEGADAATRADTGGATDPARRGERAIWGSFCAGGEPDVRKKFRIQVNHARGAFLEGGGLEVEPVLEEFGRGLRGRRGGRARERIGRDARGAREGLVRGIDLDRARPEVASIEPFAQVVRAIHGFDGHRRDALSDGFIEPPSEERFFADWPEQERERRAPDGIEGSPVWSDQTPGRGSRGWWIERIVHREEKGEREFLF